MITSERDKLSRYVLAETVKVQSPMLRYLKRLFCFFTRHRPHSVVHYTDYATIEGVAYKVVYIRCARCWKHRILRHEKVLF